MHLCNRELCDDILAVKQAGQAFHAHKAAGPEQLAAAAAAAAALLMFVTLCVNLQRCRRCTQGNHVLGSRLILRKNDGVVRQGNQPPHCMIMQLGGNTVQYCIDRGTAARPSFRPASLTPRLLLWRWGGVVVLDRCSTSTVSSSSRCSRGSLGLDNAKGRP